MKNGEPEILINKNKNMLVAITPPVQMNFKWMKPHKNKIDKMIKQIIYLNQFYNCSFLELHVFYKLKRKTYFNQLYTFYANSGTT